MTLQTDACKAMRIIQADLAAQTSQLHSLINLIPDAELPTLLEQFEQFCRHTIFAIPTDALQQFLKAQLGGHQA